MALERVLKHLSLESSSVCRQCRRTFASSPPSRKQQSETGAFAGTYSRASTTDIYLTFFSDLIQSSRAQNQTTTAAPYRGQTPITNNPRSPGSEAAPATSTSPTIARQQQASPNTANDVASTLINTTDAANRRQASSPNLAAEVNRISYRKDLESQQSRRWRSGDVYAPHDLSGVEMAKWKRVKQKARPRWDVLDQLNIKPMDHYKVSSVLRMREWVVLADIWIRRTSVSCPSM